MRNSPLFTVPGQYSNPMLQSQNLFDLQMYNEIFTANGNIYPFRFVTVIPGNRIVRQSVSGDWPIGIGPDFTQIYGQPYAATAGYQIQVFGMGRDCWVELGGTVDPFDTLKPDDNGRAVKACGANDLIAAVAYQGGTIGQLIRCKVLRRAPILQNCGFSEFTNEFDFEFGLPCNCP